MQIAIEIAAVIMLVDFASGVLHWLEDSYGRPNWPLSGKWITIPNIIHHHEPTYFTKHSWLKSAEVLLALGSAIILVAWYLNIMTWHVLLFVAIGINANEIHKWNHLPKSKKSKIVVLIQRLKLLQTSAHHANHHRGTKDTNYCVITNFLNPLLDGINFWRICEQVIRKCLGVQKRPDFSLSSNTLGRFRDRRSALIGKVA